MDNIQKRQFLQTAKQNLQNRAWLPWKEAIRYKIGDTVQLEKHRIDIAKLWQVENEFGILELHVSGSGYNEDNKPCGIAGVMSVCIPESIESNMDTTVLYTDDNIIMTKTDNCYNLSFIGADKKYIGEIHISDNGEILLNTIKS